MPSWGGSPTTLRSCLRSLAFWEQDNSTPKHRWGLKLYNALTGDAKQIAEQVTSEVILSERGYGAILTCLLEKFRPYLDVTGPMLVDLYCTRAREPKVRLSPTTWLEKRFNVRRWKPRSARSWVPWWLAEFCWNRRTSVTCSVTWWTSSRINWWPLMRGVYSSHQRVVFYMVMNPMDFNRWKITNDQTEWGAKEPQNPQNHRVDEIFNLWTSRVDFSNIVKNTTSPGPQVCLPKIHHVSPQCYEKYWLYNCKVGPKASCK